MAHTVIGFFKNSSDAYNAVDVLKDKGFDNSNIDVLPNYESTSNADENTEWTGKVGNFFKSLFTDDDNNANRYSQIAKNNSMVTVHTFNETEAERAADILDDCGAIDVNDEGYSSSTAASTASTTDYTETTSGVSFTTDKDFDRTTEASIPIIEEEVSVGKREVQRGGVRVRSRIIEKPVSETLRLREERVRVERIPVNKEATEADLKTFQEGTIELNEYGEEPIVSKTTRIVEEVRVSKEVDERQETIHETERKTEVDVENFAKTHHSDK